MKVFSVSNYNSNQNQVNFGKGSTQSQMRRAVEYSIRHAEKRANRDSELDALVNFIRRMSGSREVAPKGDSFIPATVAPRPGYYSLGDSLKLAAQKLGFVV